MPPVVRFAYSLPAGKMPWPMSRELLLDVVILVARGNREHIRNCLSSLVRYPFTMGELTVWVVDNASDDGTVELVRESFPWVRVLPMGRNAGFAAANNAALRQGTAPFALVLNPDTQLLEGSLDEMVQLMVEHDDIGVAGCRLVRPDGTFDHAAKRSFPTIMGAIGHFSSIGRRQGASMRMAQYRAPELAEHESGEVDAVNGAFMLVRRSAVAAVGSLDEGYWMYGEDLDWCYRFKQAGWKVWYQGSTTAIHVKAGTTGSYRHLRQNAAFHHAMARFYRKFYAGRRPVLDVAVYAGITAKFLVSAARSALARTAQAAGAYGLGRRAA